VKAWLLPRALETITGMLRWNEREPTAEARTASRELRDRDRAAPRASAAADPSASQPAAARNAESSAAESNGSTTPCETAFICRHGSPGRPCGGNDLMWWLGLICLAVAGVLPVWTRYMDHSADTIRDRVQQSDIVGPATTTVTVRGGRKSMPAATFLRHRKSGG
jgi:hypothetical protein